ncbi:response regulator, partial [Methylobacterium sp. WL120]|uniref:response regulator n=1 Tax=Methylobacterium sp. WL120 TaxID=2603887 RepID=UPI001FED607E
PEPAPALPPAAADASVSAAGAQPGGENFVLVGDPPAAPAPKTPPRKPSADHTGQGVILLVEDEDPVRAVNSRALSARGYTVLEAASGIDALHIVREGGHQIDLVVSDVVMPEMDGPTLLREIRKHLPELKVIFVSGYAEDAFRKNLPEGETFNFLPKPFSLKQLVETVKATMAEP